MAASERLLALLDSQERSLAELRTLIDHLAAGHAGLVEAVRVLAAEAVPVPAPPPAPAAPLPAASVPPPAAVPAAAAPAAAPAAATAATTITMTAEEGVRPEIAALCERMESLHGQLVANGVGVDGTEIRFLVLARQVLATAGAQLGNRLIDLLRFIDQLGAAYCGTAYAPLQAGLMELRQLIAAALPEMVLIQAAGVVASASGPRLPLAAPVILATGLSRGGQVVEPPQALQRLEAPPLLARCAWALVDELYTSLRGAFRRPLRDDLQRLLETVAAMAAKSEPHQLRSVLNVHTGYCEQAGTPAAREALAALRSEAGWIAQELKPGDRFDPDRHDHKRYERVLRPQSGTATGTVLAVRQIGLVDQGGLTIQRCIVITAS